MSHSQMEQYWPYAKKQQACTVELISRFVTWKRAVGVLLEYFKTSLKLDKQAIAASQMMAKGLAGFESELGPSCEGVFKHWSMLAHQTDTTLTASESQISSLVKKRLEILKSDLKKKVSSFEFRLNEFQKQVNKSRSFTQEAIANHEAHLLHRQQLNIANSSPNLSYDPWLQERFLQEHLQTSIVSENEFQKHMNALFHEMSVFDAHVIEELKRVLEELALILNSRWTNLQAHMAVTVNQGVQVNPLTFFKIFAEQNSLYDSQLWIRERTLQEFSRKPKEIKIIKQGLLYRPSKLGMGMWVPLLCVLTETGYFHTFSIPSKQKHLVQFYQKKDLDKNSASTLSRSEKTSEKEYLKEHGMPELSISLGQPRMSVEAVTKKAASHVFQFIILSRKPKTFLSKAIDQITRHEFKALSDCDMVEWIAIFQKNLQLLFPSGPPSPLFKTQKSIDEQVERIINTSANVPSHVEEQDKSLTLERKSLDPGIIQKIESSVTVNSLEESMHSKSLDLTFSAKDIDIISSN